MNGLGKRTGAFDNLRALAEALDSPSDDAPCDEISALPEVTGHDIGLNTGFMLASLDSEASKTDQALEASVISTSNGALAASAVTKSAGTAENLSASDALPKSSPVSIYCERPSVNLEKMQVNKKWATGLAFFGENKARSSLTGSKRSRLDGRSERKEYSSRISGRQIKPRLKPEDNTDLLEFCI
jgi:hypothetical protein